MNIEKNRNSIRWFNYGLIACLLLINMRLINVINGPYMFNDELGYLGNAAALAGRDWHEIMQGCAWYGFGWSIIIAPLFAVFDDMVIIYKSINVLNSLMCVVVFVLQVKLFSKIFNKTNQYLISVISFVTCCYPAILINSSMAWSEICLMFVFTILSYFLYSMSKNLKTYKGFIWAILLYYLYVCHNRMIGVAIAGGIAYFIILLTEKKLNKNNIIVFIMGLIFSCLFFGYLKDYLVMRNWQKGLPQGNDMVSGLANMQNLFTIQGFFDFIRVLCCHLLYICIASCGLFSFGFFAIGSDLIKKLKEHDLKAMAYPIWFILSFVSTILISSIMMHMDLSTKRLDHIYYGRYTEPVWFLWMTFGALKICDTRKIPRKYLNIYTSIIFMFSMIAYNTTQKLGTNPVNNIPNVSGMAVFFELFGNSALTVFGAVVVSLFLTYILFYSLKKTLSFQILGGVLLMFIFGSGTSYAQKTIINNQEYYKPILDQVKKVKDELKVEDIPIYVKEWPSYLQCQFIDKTINYTSSEDLEKIPSKKFYTFLEVGEIVNALNVPCEIISSSKESVLVKVDSGKKNIEKIKIPLEAIGILSQGIYDKDTDSIHIAQSEKAELAIYGPYLKMKMGMYEFDFKLRCQYASYLESAGKIVICYNGGKDILGEIEIKTQQLTDEGYIDILLPILIDKDIEGIEIYLYTEKGVSYDILSIQCGKKRDINIEEKSKAPVLKYSITDPKFKGSGFGEVEQDTFSWTNSDTVKILSYLEKKIIVRL